MTSLSIGERGGLPRARGTFLADRLFGFLLRTHRRACTVLVLLSLACFLPGFASLQPMDRDEPRFAQASKQMLETGDFVDIRFQGEARHKKPVGIYWLQAASVAAAEAIGIRDARTTMAVYRIPSLAGAIATVLLTYWAALAFGGRREALLAAAFMAASLILAVEARLAKTDAVLAACSVAAMGGLARAFLARGVAQLKPAAVLTFWIAIAAGILVKGPMIVMFAGLCAAALCVRERSARWLLALRPIAGLALALVLVAPWFIAITAKSGGAFFAASAGHDLLGKVGAAQPQHWAPPGTYLVVFFATFWPAAILAAIAVNFAWANRRDDAIAVALAWIVPAWLVFEAVPTKLPHYVMPLFPAIAIVTAIAITRGFVGPHRPAARPAALLIPLIPIGVTVGVAVAAWMLDGVVPHAGLAALIASTAVAFHAWMLFIRGQVAGAAIAAVLASAILSAGVFGLTQPILRSLKLSPRLAEAARGLDCPSPAIATLGYREPSLVFLVGTDVAMLETGADAARFLDEGPCRIAFVEHRFDAAFQRELDRLGMQPALVTRVAGFNINGGRHLDIGVYAMPAAPVSHPPRAAIVPRPSG